MLGGQHQGTVTVWTGLLQHLPSRHEYILYSFDPELTRTSFPQAHFEHRRIPVRNPWLRFLAVYPWLARRDRCDVFHLNYYAPPLGMRGIVVTLHDLLYLDLARLAPPRQRLVQRVFGWIAARRAAAVIVVSDYTGRRLQHHFAVSPDRVFVVPNALADEWLAPSEEAVEREWARLKSSLPARYTLSVGRWEPRKNHVLAAEVTAQLRERGLVDGLVVVGADDFGASSMRAELRERGLDTHVTSLTDLSVPALQAVYRHARTLLFLSEGEGFGYPLIEAMSMGTPVIASNRGAIFEVCGDAAIIIDDLSAGAVVNAAVGLLDDPLTIEQLRVRGRARARQFDARTYARRVVEVYERVGRMVAL